MIYASLSATYNIRRGDLCCGASPDLRIFLKWTDGAFYCIEVLYVASTFICHQQSQILLFVSHQQSFREHNARMSVGGQHPTFVEHRSVVSCLWWYWRCMQAASLRGHSRQPCVQPQLWLQRTAADSGGQRRTSITNNETNYSK